MLIVCHRAGGVSEPSSRLPNCSNAPYSHIIAHRSPSPHCTIATIQRRAIRRLHGHIESCPLCAIACHNRSPCSWVLLRRCRAFASSKPPRRAAPNTVAPCHARLPRLLRYRRARHLPKPRSTRRIRRKTNRHHRLCNPRLRLLCTRSNVAKTRRHRHPSPHPIGEVTSKLP